MVPIIVVLKKEKQWMEMLLEQRIRRNNRLAKKYLSQAKANQQ
jgi:hypothetical protein